MERRGPSRGSMVPRAAIICWVCLAGCQEYSLRSTAEGPVGGPWPLIDVSPEFLKFGEVTYGVDVTDLVTITNVGEARLSLTQIGVDHAAYSFDAPGPRTLDPGEQLEAFVTYRGRAAVDLGSLRVHSSDPIRSVVEVPLSGGLDARVPVAVCGVTPGEVPALYETATWVGSGSFDPAGGSLRYAWSVVSVPAGSAAPLPSGGTGASDRPGFLPDVVGTYTAQLVVTNTAGVESAPCTVDLVAVPATDLWVEMFWQEPGDDMDLHLVRGGGDLTTNEDCYFSNCRFGLDWGPGGPAADPLLDIDDIALTGPENINIDLPEDGTYEVYVHDFPLSVLTAPNEVTVQIYLSGKLVLSDVRWLEGEDAYAHIATVDWGAQTVTRR